MPDENNQKQQQISKAKNVSSSRIVKTDEEEEERILGSFASSPLLHQIGDTGSYHIFVTNKRIMGIKLRPSGSVPKTAKDLENPDGRVDFSVSRRVVFRVTMLSAGKNRNVFVIRTRNGIALKVLLRHSTEKEFQREKILFLDGFNK
jgi:hypothetical protein